MPTAGPGLRLIGNYLQLLVYLNGAGIWRLRRPGPENDVGCR